MLFESCLEELVKLGTVSDEQAEKALARYQSLKESKPEAGQVARYSALGAAVAPAMHISGNLLKGEGLHKAVSVADRYKDTVGRVRAKGVGRALAGSAITGAVGMGMVPIARHWLDQHAERGKLKAFLQQHEQEKGAASIVPELYGLGRMSVGGPKLVQSVLPPAELEARVSRMQNGMVRAGTRAGGAVERAVGKVLPNKAGGWLGRVGGKVTKAIVSHPIGGIAGSALPVPGGTALGVGAEEGVARLLRRVRRLGGR